MSYEEQFVLPKPAIDKKPEQALRAVRNRHGTALKPESRCVVPENPHLNIVELLCEPCRPVEYRLAPRLPRGDIRVSQSMDKYDIEFTL